MRRYTPIGPWVAERLLYPARHIRWKIIAPYLILTILLAAAGTYIATRLVTGSLEERFSNQLAEAARVTSDSIVRRERKHLEVVRAISFTDGVATSAESGNELLVDKLVAPIAANHGAELVEVLNANGQRVAGLQLTDAQTLKYDRMPADPVPPSTWPITKSVLAGETDSLGDKFAQVVQTRVGYALFTAGPIYDGDKLAGVVLVGTPLSSVLPVSKGEALADVTVYDFKGVPLATTFADSKDKKEVDLTPRTKTIDQLGSPAGLREQKDLFGRGYDLLYAPLVIRNRTVGIVSVALPSSFILSAGSSTRWQMGLIFAMATALVLGTGWLLARSFTQPILRLVSTAREVSAGDLTARSGVHTPDEIGVLATSFDAMTERLQRQHLSTVKALTSAIDARDPYTAGHAARVGHLAVQIGERLGLPDSQLQHLEIGGYLHDIGKIGVRDSILLKSSQLTPDERELMERHPRVGLDILQAVELPPEVIAFVGGHHEKIDGSGYPERRKGPDVTIIARIAAVSDMYDALTTDRPYRNGLSPQEALEIIDREATDGRLDTRVVAALAFLIPSWERQRRSDPSLKGFHLPERPLAEAA
jgi:putative nucleotidyltransferase with HDIG domain